MFVETDNEVADGFRCPATRQGIDIAAHSEVRTQMVVQVDPGISAIRGGGDIG